MDKTSRKRCDKNLCRTYWKETNCETQTCTSK